jgi:hypothetical protein
VAGISAMDAQLRPRCAPIPRRRGAPGRRRVPGGERCADARSDWSVPSVRARSIAWYVDRQTAPYERDGLGLNGRRGEIEDARRAARRRWLFARLIAALVSATRCVMPVHQGDDTEAPRVATA